MAVLPVYSKLQTSITPTEADDLTRKGYVDNLVNNKTLSALTNGSSASIESLSDDTYLMTQKRILPEFSTSQAYALNDYVTYQGKVYKCINPHPAEAWNATHFVQTTLADYIQHHLHSVAYLDGVETSLDESVAEDYPNNLPTCGAVYDFVMSGVNAFLGMGVFTKIKTTSDTTITLEDDTAIYKFTDMTGDRTLYFDASNLSSTSGMAITFELYITMGSTVKTVTFNGVTWLNNEVPSMSTPNKTYMFVFRSLDGGQTWLGSKEGAY